MSSGLRETSKKDPYRETYHLIRSAVGLIGIVLPIALIVGERLFLPGSVELRGSISAYYHSSMNDLFVGALSVIGFLLIMYRSSERRSTVPYARREFWLSFWSGVGLLTLVYFPTGRPDLPEGAIACGRDVDPAPVGCAPVQTLLGERVTASVHFVGAALFIGLLLVICLMFASREDATRRNHARFHRGCAVVIALAILWIGVGGFFDVTIGALTPLYLGELASVWAFAASWLVKGADLRRLLPGAADQ